MLGRALARWLGGDTPARPDLLGDSILAWTITADDSTPEGRDRYAVIVNAAWFILGFGFAVAFFGLGYVAHLTIGETAARAFTIPAVGFGFFCFAGGANVLWRKYYYVNQAKRRARAFGEHSEPYRTSLRRALPRNSSLVMQTLAAICAVMFSSNVW